MASTGVNVLRYTALGSGVAYGLYHQATISAAAKMAQTERENQKQKGLIQRAKTEYMNLRKPQDKSVISDPDDPKFDLEAFLTKTMKEAK